MWLVAGALVACRKDEPEEADGPAAAVVVPFAPPAGTLFRVTDAEWRNAAEDLFGARWEGALPVDYLLYNYGRVGGSELTIPPLDLELYDAAAWGVAAQASPDEVAAELLLGCAADDVGCVRPFVADRLSRAWRRPAEPDEVDEIVARYEDTVAGLGVTWAVQSTIAAILMGPELLFRVELGETDPDRPEWRRLTSDELAGRLASFLTASVPDAELARAAAAGELRDEEALLGQVDRLLATPRGQAAMLTFWSETLELHEIDAVTKDLTLYPEWTAGLRAEAVHELERLFLDVALEREAPLGELLTSSTATVGPELAALYGVQADATVQLPDDRGGLLGRAALLAVQAHNVTTSPTFRGKFVRNRLLCDDVPPPPPGVLTDLPESTGGTLRELLEQHAIDPSCKGCHTLLDPPGFALEHFDPIGRWRALDNGYPIDATGQLDGVPFDGAAELGAVVAASPKLNACWATQLYRFANARVERAEDLVVIDEVTGAFVADGERFRDLVHRLVSSPAFHQLVAPVGDACDADGETRACASGCGEGEEVCVDGAWSGCTAPSGAPESCNGVDDDCDGLVDELERTCEALHGVGTQVCEAGEWSSCAGPAPGDEVCNGVDDDLDQLVDEGLEVEVLELGEDEILAAHYACDLDADPFSPFCHAATHRACASGGCWASGFGPVDVGVGEATVACLDSAQAVVIGSTFTELATHHPDCTQSNRQGGPCNAAINRLCASRGLVTGYGPVENAEDVAVVVCTPGVSVLNGYYSVLSTFAPGCNASVRWGAECNEAIHEHCRTLGFETGHGPLENSGDLAIVACLGVL